MTDTDRDGLSLRDEDRLPWLEPVDDEDYDDEGVSPLRVALFVLLGLVLIGLVVGGVYWWQNRTPAAEGDGALIQAPTGDYKVKPNEPGGMAVEGQGDTTYAASQGAAPDAKLDLEAVPEAPVVLPQAVDAPPAPPPVAAAPRPAPAKVTSTTVPAKPARLPTPAATPARRAAPAPAPAATPAATRGGGSTVQLGAFGSEAIANAAWKRMAARFAFLAPLTPNVTQATVNGKVYYRLQASAPGQARDICGRLKVAGESCIVVGN